MSYIEYNDIYDSAIKKYSKFAIGDFVHNIVKLTDDFGILNAGSTLKIIDITLSDDAKNKIKAEKELNIDNDIIFTCQYNNKAFSIPGYELEKATNEEIKEMLQTEKANSSMTLREYFIMGLLLLGILLFIILFIVSFIYIMSNGFRLLFELFV